MALSGDRSGTSFEHASNNVPDLSQLSATSNISEHICEICLSSFGDCVQVYLH